MCVSWVSLWEKVYDLITKKVVCSRDIHFYETYSPFHHISDSSTSFPLPSPIFLHSDPSDQSAPSPTPTSSVTSANNPSSPHDSLSSPHLSYSPPFIPNTQPPPVIPLTSHDHFHP